MQYITFRSLRLDKSLLSMGLALVIMTGWVTQAHAQTTGKIAGIVIDVDSRTGLPGVNVFIEGTTQGTATNMDGEYVIIGVPPGTYTLIASFIGFATQRTENVQVNAGLTVEIDFTLREEVFEGEEIVVVAEKPRVQKDLTATLLLFPTQKLWVN